MESSVTPSLVEPFSNGHVEEVVQPRETAGGSLAEKVQKRHRELEQASEHAIDIPVPGYESVLVARYRPLAFELRSKIAKRHAKRPEAEMNLFAAADYLINACEEILERQDDELVPTGYRWGTQIAQDVWGIEAASARLAVLAIFKPPRDNELIEHANDLVEQSRSSSAEVDELLVGESEAGLTN